MSWESQTSLFPWIAKYYTKEEQFSARCKCDNCEQRIEYVFINNFEKHIREEHENVFDFEKKNIDNVDWKSFILINKNEIKCIVCQKRKIVQNILQSHIIQSSILSDHKTTHKEELECYGTQDWPWKYLAQNGDLSGKCKICQIDINFQLQDEILVQHLLDVHNVIVSSTQKIQSWKILSKKNSWMEKCYIKTEDDFRVKCKICSNTKLLYIDDTSIIKHVKEEHKGIAKLEYLIQDYYLNVDWTYLRVNPQMEQRKVEFRIECMLCQKLLPKDSSTEDHLKNHSDEERNFCVSQYISKPKLHWAFKYMRQYGDFVICTICGKNVNFSCRIDNLQNHTRTSHPDDWKRIEDLIQTTHVGQHDQVVPSTS